MGERGRMIFSENQVMTATTPHKPIDTTRAGGSFNLAYLTQRSDAKEPKFTATFAIGLALTVIMRPGAVLPEKRP